MQLTNVSYASGSEVFLHPLDLTLVSGAINVLLGATESGKTTTLRIIAGLDRPATGTLTIEGRDVTGISVRHRDVAMVYQQFINYPSLSVYENIASPLRIARKSDTEVRARVTQLAEVLRLTPFLDRYPAQLSGGQQQRTALARALAKDARLLLLDEPLVNLDYKLREELRVELAQLFAERQTTVVYATTEPQEALQLGGRVAVLSKGRLLQAGPTLEVFRQPATLAAARAFSDPPLNVLRATLDTTRHVATLPGGITVPARTHATDTEIFLGIRPHQLTLTATTDDAIGIAGRIELAEISGSDTYLHLAAADTSIVAQIPGVHARVLGDPCTFYFSPRDLYCFSASGARAEL